MISYGDFLTTLLSFFIVMFAISKVNNVRLLELSQSIQQAFGANKFITVSSTKPNIASSPKLVISKVIRRPSVMTKSNKNLIHEKNVESRVFNGISSSIKKFISKNDKYKSSLKIYQSSRGLIISLKGSSFFRPGSAALLKEFKPVLANIANKLLGIQNNISIEGYTDSIPIHTAKYPDNWALSTARAVNVLRFLINTGGVSPERLSAAGYGQYKPVASNSTSKGRALNRRVDIVVLSSLLNNQLPKS